MENQTYSNELQHHGIKGMKWGQRLYQNKDGSLTPLGQKRYNKEVEKLKKETAKVKAKEKAAANRKKTQDKFDKLEAKKQALEERKKALKGKTDNKIDEDNSPEALEARREKLLKSTNAKELYENKDALSSQELNDRINRIDLETRLQSKIIEEPTKTGMDYVNKAKNVIDTATGLFRSVDNAYSTVANSAIGKTLAKQLGIELQNEKDKKFDINKLRNKANKTLQDMETLQKYSNAEKNYLTNTKQIKNLRKQQEQETKEESERQKREAEKEKRETEKTANKQAAQQKVDEYNERWNKGQSEDRVSGTTYSKFGEDITDRRTTTKSSKSESTKTSRLDDDDVEIIPPDWYKKYQAGSGNTSMSNAPSTEVYSIGQSYIAGYLEDKR